MRSRNLTLGRRYIGFGWLCLNDVEREKQGNEKALTKIENFKDVRQQKRAQQTFPARKNRGLSENETIKP